jgi:hypothetical protein
MPCLASLAGTAKAPLFEEVIDDMSWGWPALLKYPVQMSPSRRMAGEDSHTAAPQGYGYTELIPDTGIDFLKHHRHSCLFIIMPANIVRCRVHSVQAELSHDWRPVIDRAQDGLLRPLLSRIRSSRVEFFHHLRCGCCR